MVEAGMLRRWPHLLAVVLIAGILGNAQCLASCLANDWSAGKSVCAGHCHKRPVEHCRQHNSQVFVTERSLHLDRGSSRSAMHPLPASILTFSLMNTVPVRYGSFCIHASSPPGIETYLFGSVLRI